MKRKSKFYQWLKVGPEKGQSLVEMAILTPLLLFFLLGIFEVGSAVRNYLVLVNTNREITRFAVRPNYLDFSTVDTIDDSYLRVREWVDVTLSNQLSLNFSEVASKTGNATLIISHVVVDTGLPCKDIYTSPANCDCNALAIGTEPDVYPLDDLIIHPGKSGMEFQAKRFGPAQTSTGAKTSRLNYDTLAQGMVAQNNQFNCELIKKGGLPSTNNLVVTELFVDQPQLFGFPFISNPYTDPFPLYTQTTMRLPINRGASVNTTGPVCMAYPITFGQSIFNPNPDNPPVPTAIDAFEGDAAGNFGWITWNPNSSYNNANYIEDELDEPRLSLNDFTDANQPSDHGLSIGDDVSTKPGVANSSGVDDKLQALAGQEILVPVYSNNPGTGANSYYTVSHFAKIRVDQICLPRNGNTCSGQNKNEIKATFLGYMDELCPADGTVGGGGGANQPPVANDDSVSTATNVAVPINVLVNDTDPNTDTLTITANTSPSKGTLSGPVAGVFTYTPQNNHSGEGSFTFTYTISDGRGGADTATVTINVTARPNTAPIATADSYTTNEDSPLSVTAANGVLKNDTDPESDPLTAGNASVPSHGTVTLNADGSFTYTPTAGFFGADSFTYKANDGLLDSTAATVSIQVIAINRPPVANTDSYTINEDTPLNQAAPGVLANDTDSNGDPLTAAKVSNPAHGTVTVNANGSFLYTPAANFFGTDTFTYQVSDGVNPPVNGTVNIIVNPVNDAPVAGNDGPYNVECGVSPTTIAAPGVLEGDTDPDNFVWSLTKVGGPSKGSVTLNSDGSFSFTPNSGVSGSDTFTYKLNDGTVDSNVATVSIAFISTNMHIKSMGISTTPSGTKYYGNATVKVVDGCGSPVAGALVSGAWKKVPGNTNANISDSATSDASGNAVVTTNSKYSGSTVFQFCVSSITLSGKTYLSSANEVSNCANN